MRTLICLFLLIALSFAGDIDSLVDQLFHHDPKARESARKQLLAREKDTLAKVLARIEEREAKKPSKNATLRIHAIRDLKQDKVHWPAALAHLQELDAVIREQPNGVLIVHATKEVQAQVAKQLAELRRRLSRVVRVESSVVELPKGTKTPRGFARGEFETWIKQTGAKVTRFPSLTCRNGQHVEVTTTRMISYVADFDIEVKQGTFTADPIVDTLPRGISLEIRPLASEDGESVQLNIDVRSSEVKLPMAETKLEVPFGRTVRIQTPESRLIQVRTSRRVRGGASTVVDLGTGMDGIRRVLVVTPTPERLLAK